MIYPNSFEQKIGFDEVRNLVSGFCLSALGKEMVGNMTFSSDAAVINEWLNQVREFRRLQEETDDFPLQYFFDVRESVARIRLEGTYMEESELFDLKRSLDTIHKIVGFLAPKSDAKINYDEVDSAGQDGRADYPSLYRLTLGIKTFPQLVIRIDGIVDRYGKIKDSASQELSHIRRELAKSEGAVSRTLYNILRTAQSDGLVEKDVTPTIRDGRLVIPIAPGLKRKIKGIVHDESATGKTVFVEPTEVVEANNRIRELENEERKEIIRILKEFAATVRPHVKDIIASYKLLAHIDFIRAKAEFAKMENGFEPNVETYPHIDWIRAVHPLLRIPLEKQGKKVVPLDITLTKDKRILIISGPNAGGKSVCLKTVGLLQYMLQCGLPVPVGDRSTVGVFKNIMIDIGDEQSIENDLSTYSSHLMNMKNMMKFSNDETLLLIDEFGTGTEPQIGGAIAEAVLKQFCNKKAWGVITTHYQNLKHFAESHDYVVNAAMLYDRKEMRALFQLAIGRPGSSFAIEIARKTGIPEEVIRDASDIVGSDYIQSDKYLQDIVRDKRYWEGKRQTIHQREKDMERIIAKYESDLAEIDKSRKDVLRRAKEQAEELLRESNKKIENTIREIRESQAEKEETKRIREELDAFKQEVSTIDTKAEDEKIARKIAQIQRRKERKEERKKKKATEKTANANPESGAGDNNKAPQAGTGAASNIAVGSSVRIKGLTSVGTLVGIEGKIATVIFGDMRTKMKLDRLERVKPSEQKDKKNDSFAVVTASRMTREAIDDRQKNFHHDLDVRGMRGDEALNQVQYYIDDAILVGAGRVRILHGKGNGILRQLIRQYLNTVPNVASCRDEHVQFGGAGITVVDLE